MSWQIGAIVVVILACVVPYVVAQLIHDFGTQDDWDVTAERKRMTERKAKQLSREFKSWS